MGFLRVYAEEDVKPATREKALTERDFERLLQAAYRIDDDQQALEARALILVGGRLGLRPGELTHLSSSWIDWQRQMIRKKPCSKLFKRSMNFTSLQILIFKKSWQ